MGFFINQKFSQMKLTCYPKINLGLRVHPIDNLGYHPIQSIFLYSIGELKDEIQISPNQSTEISITNYEIEKTENLVYKAHLALRQNGVCLDKHKITITKKIPTGAGLGGGSSNAGIYLKAFGSELKNLERVALGLGADIPFFLQNKACIVSGYGEILQPIEEEIEIPAVIITSNVHCATKEIFKVFDELPKVHWEYKPKLIIEHLLSADPALMQYLSNDLERASSRLHPKLAELFYELRQILIEQCFYCGMSGSGSSFFALFKTLDRRQTAYEELREAGFQAYKSRLCSMI